MKQTGIYFFVLMIGTGALLIVMAGCGDPVPLHHSAPTYSSPTYLKSDTSNNAVLPIRRSANTALSFNKGKGFSTIVLNVYYYPGALEQARTLQKRARNLFREKDVWLENISGGVSVNLGRFTTHDKASKKCRSIQKNYRRLRTGAPFCYVKDISAPAPIAPQQWDLLRSNCLYTIEVGRYYNDSDKGYYDRKKDAVEAVRILREDNETAFFVHGQTESRIYVGCFGSYDIQQENKGSQMALTFSPEIQRLKEKYPFLGENGVKVNRIYKDKRTGLEKKSPMQSLIVNVDLIRAEVTF